MKKLLLFCAMLISSLFATAQFQTVNFTNNTGLTDLYIKFGGNDGSGLPCSSTNFTGSIGPIAPSSTITYTVTSVPWSPSATVFNFVVFGFDRIPGFPMPSDFGPYNGLCPAFPSSPHTYSFTSWGGTYTMNFSSTAPGVIDFDLR